MTVVNDGNYLIYSNGYLRTPSGTPIVGKDREKADNWTKGHYLTLITGKGLHTKDPGEFFVLSLH